MLRMTLPACQLPSFEAFFRRHERNIFGYLWRMTGDEQAAYDLSQETFVRAWQHFDRIASYERPGGSSSSARRTVHRKPPR